ncbi:DMT family transporter [Sporomusa sp. KB1]|jgi:drug/metabolite transporter (DMT)-like permease|uniref:DMT family transporter n=1 Tax=Sporomusa sp. KB1 TaxID=943346 RepID=UPI0011AA6121|nr:DMT family transporter [Sporomusa sp. KB1]TWH47302.1 drug/metabolite transporter (DMT)-like permease [Sporomusa sp. KB1]
MTRLNKAYFAALLYALIIGFSFMFVKIALTSASPMDTLAHRFTIAFLAASIPLVAKQVRLDINSKDFIAILPLATLYPALFFAFQAFGLVYTSSSEAGIIQASVPIFTLVLAAHFLKEHSTKWQKLSTLLSVAGVVYIFVMKGFVPELANTKGIILILLSTLSAACYNVLARNLTRQYSLTVLTYIMAMLGMITFNGIAIIQHVTAHTLAYYFAPFTNRNFFVSTLYLGVLSSLGTSFLSNYALSKMEASKMSVFNNLATLITIFAGVVFLHEKLEYFHVIGAAIIIIGVVGTNFLGKDNNEDMD